MNFVIYPIVGILLLSGCATYSATGMPSSKIQKSDLVYDLTPKDALSLSARVIGELDGWDLKTVDQSMGSATAGYSDFWESYEMVIFVIALSEDRVKIWLRAKSGAAITSGSQKRIDEFSVAFDEKYNLLFG